MKIYRGARTAAKWSAITEKPSIAEWAKDWNPGKVLTVDATIDKKGHRHSEMGIQFDETDLALLSDGYLQHMRNEIARLQSDIGDLRDQVKEQESNVKVLETAMAKISRLITYHAQDAPSIEKLMETVQSIAEHYYYNVSDEDRPEIDWVEWSVV